MTYNVFGGTLYLAVCIYPWTFAVCVQSGPLLSSLRLIRWLQSMLIGRLLIWSAKKFYAQFVLGYALVSFCLFTFERYSAVCISSYQHFLSSYLPLPSARQQPSYGDCLEVRGNLIRTAPCWVVWHNVHSQQQHTHVSSSYRSSRLGLSHWDAYAMHRGCCLELYYCNMVEWSWWDSSLISKTIWFPSVLWHCWFGHMTRKNPSPIWPIMCLVGR